MINSIYSQPGYLEVVNFLNSESSSPTVGTHSVIVADVFDTLATSDYWGMAQEIYNDADLDEYAGCLFVTQSGHSIMIVNGVPTGINLQDSEVRSVFNVETGKGLIEMFSDMYELYDIPGLGIPVEEIQVYKEDSLGGDIYSVRRRINNEVIGKGEVKSLVVQNQRLGAYNIKIDKDVSPVISFVSARDSYTQFEIRISPTERRKFRYTKIGQLLYVEDNEYSRADLKRLSKEKVVFYN